MSCPHKHYSELYEYGNYETQVGDQVFYFSYTNTTEERHAVQEEIKREIQRYQRDHKGEIMELGIGNINE
jgi:hypothetical protein